MAKSIFIYSTLTCDNAYTNYGPGGGDIPIAEPSILIKGGANAADKRIVTPYGVVTEVTEDQLASLEKNADFQLHKKNGFITVSTSKKDPEVVAADMTPRSPDAPLVEGDYEEPDEEDEEQLKVTTNAPKPKKPKATKAKK